VEKKVKLNKSDVVIVVQ